MQPIEELLNQVQALAAVASDGQVRSVLAVVARCTIEVSEKLAQFSDNISQAQKILGARLSELNSNLEKSSTETLSQTAALVQWTKVLVFVTAAYTLITCGILLVTIFN